MRPVERGDSPIAEDFDNYRDAFPELQSRLGPYCSYCERRLPTQLAVEHIQPKGLQQYEHLEGSWNNFLLSCVNCNSTKGDADVPLDQLFLPDRDNTFVAFEYRADGRVESSAALEAAEQRTARDTLSPTGLDKRINEVEDSNGRLVAIDRVAQRMEAWLVAEESRSDLHTSPSDALQRQIVRTALESGFFSTWMTVFADETDMRRRFVDEFPGTAQDCFDAATQPVSPRVSQLPGGGKL